MLVSTISGCNTGIGRYANFVAKSFNAMSIFFKIKKYEDDSCFNNTIKITPLSLLFSYYFGTFKKFFDGKYVFFSSPDLVNYAKVAKSSIVTVHDVFPLQYKVKPVYKEYFIRMLKHLEYTTAIITNSYYTKTQLEDTMEKFNIEPVPIHVVHLGVMGLRRIGHEYARRFISSTLGIDAKKIVLNIANAQERKNLKEITTIKGLLGRDFVFITVGHNNNYGDVSLEGIDDYMLSILMAGADVCLSTSLDEGFNLPIIECAFYGTPSVVTNIAVHRELSKYQKLFIYDNVEEAVKLIKEVSSIRVDFSDYFHENRIVNDLKSVLKKYYFL